MLFQFQLGSKPTIKIRYEFRKARINKKSFLGKADTQLAYDGTVNCILTINRANYGPYTTQIRTFRAVWDGRSEAKPSSEAKLLIRQLVEFESAVEHVYDELIRLGRVIDGQVVMQAIEWLKSVSGSKEGLDIQKVYDVKSPFEVVTLPRVYKEFMDAKEEAIEPSQKKRSVEQISESTYSTYSKRWVMVQGYLDSIGRTKFPVASVDYEFATNFKEWMRRQRKPDGEPYQSATVNKAISFVKMLLTYSQSKGYISHHPLISFSCRGGSVANPKPLTEAQLAHLETCDLPPMLRLVCDSWLVAAELCLHYSDYMQLPKMKVIETIENGEVVRVFQHSRKKQQGGRDLKQTIDVTPRAERILEKYGVRGLYYRSSTAIGKRLKEIAAHANLVDEEGQVIGLQFGQGRDTGLTHRAIDGATSVQLSAVAGWSKPDYANRYIGNPVAIVEQLARKRNALRS